MRRAGTVQPIDGSDTPTGDSPSPPGCFPFPCTAALHTDDTALLLQQQQPVPPLPSPRGGWIRKIEAPHRERTLDVVWYSGRMCTPHFQRASFFLQCGARACLQIKISADTFYLHSCHSQGISARWTCMDGWTDTLVEGL